MYTSDIYIRACVCFVECVVCACICAYVIMSVCTRPPVAILDAQCLPKSIETSLYSRSVATLNMNFVGAFLIKLCSAQAFSSYFHKMATDGLLCFSDYLQNR